MAEQIKIFYLITSTNVGGTEKALFELISRIDKKKYHAYVCSIKKPGAFASRISREAAGFYTLGLSEAGGLKALLTFLPALIALIRLLRRLRPQIIHSFLFRANILGRIAGRITGVLLVISSIRVIEHKPYKHLIDRCTSALVTKYIAVSEAVRRFTEQHAHIRPKKIVTIYNGIDCDRHELNEPGYRTMAAGLKKIALIGRFDRQKGHAILIKALKQVIATSPDIKVHFAGAGPLESPIRNMVHREGCADHVVFDGIVEEIVPYITQMNIIVLPSLWEGLPNVLLEAMLAARPVIASRIEGIDEVVIDGKTGILCTPGDPASLAEALEKLLSNKKLAEEMGRHGRDRVHDRFAIQKTVHATLALYQELLKDTRKIPNTID